MKNIRDLLSGRMAPQAGLRTSGVASGGIYGGHKPPGGLRHPFSGGMDQAQVQVRLGKATLRNASGRPDEFRRRAEVVADPGTLRRHEPGYSLLQRAAAQPR